MTTYSTPRYADTRSMKNAKLTYTLEYDPTGEFGKGATFGKSEVIPSVFAVGTRFKDRAGGRFVMTARGLVAE
jgi:hypothetical protein